MERADHTVSEILVLREVVRDPARSLANNSSDSRTCEETQTKYGVSFPLFSDLESFHVAHKVFHGVASLWIQK